MGKTLRLIDKSLSFIEKNKSSMPKSLLLSILALLFTFSSHSQLGCKVEISVKNYQGNQIYIGYNLMGKTYVRDTLVVTDGKFVLEDMESIERGMYMAVYPETMNYFEFLMGSDQKFRLDTEFDNEIHGMVITGSEENEILYEFFQNTDLTNVRISELDEEAKNLAVTTTSYTENREEREQLNAQIETYKRQVMANYPQLVVSKLIHISFDVEFPEELSEVNSDDETRFKYYRKHYFDCVDFSEQALLRTNLLSGRIDTYMSRLTMNDPDSIIATVHHICDLSRANKEVFKSVVVYLLNKYASSKLIGMDAVYVDMVETYYLSGDVDWIEEENLASMKNRAETLKPTLIGKKAAKISGIDTNGNSFLLKPSDAEHTIVLFWNYSDANSIAAAQDFQAMMEVLDDPTVQLISIATLGIKDTWKESLASANLSQANQRYYLLDTNTDQYVKNFDFDGMRIKTYLIDSNGIIDLKQFNAEQVFNYLGGAREN